MAKILVLHGPNLNLLGQREQDHYGSYTLSEINQRLRNQAESLGHQLETFQTNSEYELLERIHQAAHDHIELMIINAAAFTHTSIALRDALIAIAIPFIEVHMSNIYGREPFRAQSYLSDIAIGVISGFQETSYYLALDACQVFFNKQHDLNIYQEAF